MFTAHANKAKELSENVGEIRYLYSYTIIAGRKQSVIIKAKDHIAAKKQFEREFPTAKIINTLILD